MNRSSKKSAGDRRTSQPPRGAVRPGAPAAKITGARKAAGEGVLPGMLTPNKKTTQRQGFKTNEFIVYPAHGVGQIVSIEEQEVAGAKLELFVISFIKDKMTLRVPTAKVVAVGMRKLAEGGLVKRALETLKGRARIKRTMWSRRAQEYEAKINSGDIVAIAEVVRDLFRSDSQPEQSYSERQLYEAALDRLSREIAAVQHITETEAIKEIEAALAKGPRRGPKPAEGELVEEEAA
jgi:CarD family transcriptional regulator